MIKICKECGKEFEAKNARQAYCNRRHYRPCPVCGVPVFAKYLSDPARSCSNKCKSARNFTPITISQEEWDRLVAEAEEHAGSTEEVAPKNDSAIQKSSSVKTSDTQRSIKLFVPADKITKVEEPKAVVERKQNNNPFTADEILEKPVIAKFMHTSTCPTFIKDHVYVLKAKKTFYSYEIEALQDVTDSEILENSVINCSSMTSFNVLFERVSTL